MELKGPDNSLRVRQIRLLGGGIARSFNALAIHQRTCETETLRVFRLLTSQVFGHVSYEDEAAPSLQDVPIGEVDCDDDVERIQDNDLKEHMVGILFSGKKLTHLQRQVCSHILHGIQRETIRLKEEWETLVLSDYEVGQDLFSARVSDSYCFELLSQVLALSGSRLGREYISQQTTLPADLLSLLHTGSPRIQRQVTALLRRVLPELPPSKFASLVGIEGLPCSDYGILQYLNSSPNGDRHGILDVFLACIAKVLTLQVKSKGRDKESSKVVSSVSMASVFSSDETKLGSRWWMRGTIPRRVAESIIQLVKDMASGSLSKEWADVTKASIAEAVLTLTKLEEDHRSPSDCLQTPSLWLTLAALCLLQDEHVERLSSTQWANPRGAVNKPLCSNHDDGETGAQIVCSDCGPLCVECDRVLHFPRKFHSHQRQVCKEEEEAIKVDVHEGCGRVKLFWILALSDARNLKSLVEFRNGSAPSTSDGPSCALVGSTVSCRYCGSVITSSPSLFDGHNNVCTEPECQELEKNACSKTLQCGHPCGGVRGESQCLPCLQRCSDAGTLKQDADDMCMICFTEALSAAPAIQLKCKHVFHAHCCQAVLSRKWPGPRITFGFSTCPICKVDLEHEFLDEFLKPVRELFEDVKRKALMRLEYEGLHQTEAITLPGSRFYLDAEGFAMERYAYYVCFKCNKAYYGGEARCEAELAFGGRGDGAVGGAGEGFNPAELVCGGCSDVARAQMCPRHGADYLEYKCRYCCSVAVFFCFGTTHFCNPCHEDFRHVTELPKHALPKCPAGPRGRQLDSDECPLHVIHPPTGEEFALGCGICRNAHTF